MTCPPADAPAVDLTVIACVIFAPGARVTLNEAGVAVIKGPTPPIVAAENTDAGHAALSVFVMVRL